MNTISIATRKSSVVFRAGSGGLQWGGANGVGGASGWANRAPLRLKKPSLCASAGADDTQPQCLPCARWRRLFSLRRVLAGPALERWCDKGDTWQILQGSIALQLMATGAILFCQGYLLFVIFVLLVGLRSVFASVAAPAINVLAMRVTGLDQRPRFYALLNTIYNSAKRLAPAL